MSKKIGRPTVITEEKLAQILALREQGQTVREIAQAVGLPKSTVGRHLDRHQNPTEFDRNMMATHVARYDKTIEQYGAMVAAQDGACAICGKVERLHIDHDH